MSIGIFIINDRFRIYPALNQLQDMQTSQIIRLEPRIMAVLRHLAQNSGQLVTRDELIRDIWNNYGGGDEGLSQAISFLRKTLGDHAKTLIQTVPKKGYCLTVAPKLDEAVQQPTKRVTALPKMRSLLRYMVLLYVLGTAVYFISDGKNLHSTDPNQKARLIALMETAQLPPAVSPGVKKLLPVATNNKSASVKIRSKVKDTSSAAKMLVPTNNPPNILLANAETKFHNINDPDAQITTSLDYQVTTSIRVSTTIN